jgi:hypothetical protein
VGDLLRSLRGADDLEEESRPVAILLGLVLCLAGDSGGESDLDNCACLGPGLAAQGVGGDAGCLADLLRRLSMSSSTMLIRISAGSSTLARLTVRLRKFSAILSQP